MTLQAPLAQLRFLEGTAETISESSTGAAAPAKTPGSEHEMPPQVYERDSLEVNDRRSTRKMLVRVACIADDIIRASEEKVNVAQAACDSVSWSSDLSYHDSFPKQVDRHIRMLELAIREQEGVVLEGYGPAHLRPSLPDLTALRASRPLRPVPGDEEMESVEQLTPNQEHETQNLSAVDKKGTQRNRGKSGRSRPDGSAEQEKSLTITVPASTAVAEPDERTYCYCNRESFGEVRQGNEF